MKNIRALAAHLIFQVVEKGASLSTVLPVAQQSIPPKDKALIQELCFGSLRWLRQLNFMADQLIEKPLKAKYRPLHYLILIGIYQLFYTRIPAHAAISETVNGAKPLKGDSFRGFINGVLREAQRQQDTLLAQCEAHPAVKYSYPGWLFERIKTIYPDRYEYILEQGNQKPPMWIRANQRQTERDTYLVRLRDAGIEAEIHPTNLSAIKLEKPCDVFLLPDFAEGASSVQDAAAQFAAHLLAPEAGDLILDACAAPGGKTAHMLEMQPGITQLVAVDNDAKRLQRVEENLTRLHLQADIRLGDAAQPAEWWQGPAFDKILLDAPCSATGVIRRHPDIKWLRRKEDIAELVRIQRLILEAMWQILRPGGTLLYATCSILEEENTSQIRSFLADTPDAELIPLHSADTPAHPGWQILPGDSGMDGFYYAKLTKRISA
jgi:16S rRNA (cytosine967-C5)-methyltransferase